MQDAIKLDGGKLTLFKRNGLWQARIYVGDRRYLWRSLKTAKQAEARAAGMRLLHETQFKQAQGLPVTSRSFNAVIDEYVAWRQRDHEVGRQVPNSSTKHTSAAMLRQVQRVVKFWREYAGTRAIDAVDDRALRDYLPWRRAYYTGVAQLPKNAKLHPTDKTLQWEIMLGKALVKFAHDQGYRGTKPLPTFSFIPTALDTNRCPFGCSDGSDALGIIHEPVPCIGAGVQDVIVAVPDASRELVGSQVLPDILHAVQFRSIGRQGEQHDVGWHDQFASGLMPSGAVADHRGDGAWRDMQADFGEMQGHALGAGGRRDDRRTETARGTDRAEQVGVVVTIVTHHGRTGPHRRPDIGQRPLLPDPGFILEPDFDTARGGAAQQGILQMGAEVFLKASCASASFFG